MKRRIALLLCFVMLLPSLFLLASCGGNGDGPYTVTFSIDGRETKVTVEKGEIPVCPEELLSWETAEHYYKVTGWDKEIVPAKSNATYVATVGEYGLTVYNVRFNMPYGFVGAPTHEGELPTPPEGYETDLSRVDKIGTFERWSPELVAPTAENMEGKKTVVYTPVYTYDRTRYFTVTFNVNGTEYKVQTAGNTVPVCPVDPAEAGQAFRGWDKAIGKTTADTVYTAWYGGDAAEILPAKDGAKSILTMTYDRDSSEWLVKNNEKYGLRGSEMLIAARLNSDRVATWKRVFSKGTLEPESLSMTHDSKRITSTPEINRIEVVDSKARIEELFPGSAVICYGSPYAQLSSFSYSKLNEDGSPDKSSQKIEDGGTKALARETYFAIRNGVEGLNSLDPACTDEAGGWYNLMVQWFYNYDWQTDEIRAGWIDNAVKNGGWLVILAHDFVDDPTDYLSLSKDEAEAFFAHASSYIKRGDLWSATFGEATRYIRERQGSTAYQRIENGVVYLGLKIDRTTEDGKTMDENVFNYPLTVKVRVPADWNTVGYELGSETVTATCYTDPDGYKYANVNAVPGADGTVATVAVSRVN